MFIMDKVKKFITNVSCFNLLVFHSNNIGKEEVLISLVSIFLVDLS